MDALRPRISRIHTGKTATDWSACTSSPGRTLGRRAPGCRNGL